MITTKKEPVLEYGWTRRPVDRATLTPAQLKELKEYEDALRWASHNMGEK